MALLRGARIGYKSDRSIRSPPIAGSTMDEAQLLSLKPELDRFLDRYAPLFGRDENQAHARRFLQGLLRKGERRNIENIAEALDGGPVRSLQAFVTTGAWHDPEILAALRRDVLAVLAEEDAVWN